MEKTLFLLLDAECAMYRYSVVFGDRAHLGICVYMCICNSLFYVIYNTFYEKSKTKENSDYYIFT